MNEKMYPKLSADERFKIVINIFINDDKVQHEKLVKSCPMIKYSILNPAYTEKNGGFQGYCYRFYHIQLLEYDKVIAVMKILNGFNYKK